MKKLIIAIFLCLVLVNVKLEAKTFTLSDYFSGEIAYYTDASFNNSINLGFCSLTEKKNEEVNIIGESIVLKNYEVDQILRTLKARFIQSECLDCGIVVIYAISPLVNKNVTVGDFLVNLQIAIRENDVVVGWPLILGSF